MLVSEERGKPEYPGKNLSEQRREATNSTHIWRRIRESIRGHIGGRRVGGGDTATWIMSKNRVVERKAFVNSFGSEGPDLKNESFFRIFSAFRIA